MIKWLVTSRTRRKLLLLFTLNPAEQFYLRQLSREIGESVPAVSQELKLMSQMDFLDTIKVGNRNFYQLNPNFPGLSALKQVVTASLKGCRNEYQPTDFRHLRFLKKELNRIVKQLIRKYHPQKVILYGSLAQERVGPQSDIDLVVIKESKQTFFKRIHEIIDLIDYDARVDFFVYTPKEFQEACNSNLFFNQEIVDKGEIIYEKAA